MTACQHAQPEPVERYYCPQSPPPSTGRSAHPPTERQLPHPPRYNRLAGTSARLPATTFGSMTPIRTISSVKGLQAKSKPQPAICTLSALGGTTLLYTTLALTHSLTLTQLAVTSLLVQLVAYGVSVRLTGSALNVSSLFTLVWVIYFPLRLMVIVWQGPVPNDFPAVYNATSPELASVLLFTTLGIVAFITGVALIRPTISPIALSPRLTIPQFRLIGIASIAVSGILLVTHTSSGLLGNIGQLSSFAIAGLAFCEARTPSKSHFSILILVAAVTLGYEDGFKQLLIVPIASLIYGRAAAGRRLKLGQAAASTVILLLIFAVVQGARAEAQYGHKPGSPLKAAAAGLYDYNLTTGVPTRYRTPLAATENVSLALLARLKGADYLLSIEAKVPSQVAFQRGATLWQPAVSTVPVVKNLLRPIDRYNTLSLGRYIDQEFVSESPSTDPSSQSTTPPGDLYLNWGNPGIVIGMVLIGIIFGAFSFRLPFVSATHTALVVYIGFPLLAMDSNLAYLIVTAGLRALIASALLIGFERRTPTPLARS